MRWAGRKAAQFTARILARDNWTCAWCGGPADTAEHLVHLSRGGAPFDPANAVAACRACNLDRGTRARPTRTPPRPSRPW